MLVEMRRGSRKGRVAVRISEEGRVYEAYEFDSFSLRAQNRFCDFTGMDKDTFHELNQKIEGGADSVEWEPPPPAALTAPTAPFSATLREREQTDRTPLTAASPAAMLEALNASPTTVPDPILEWDGTRLAVLDVDYHDRPRERRPRRETLESLADRILPRPFGWRISGGGGLHCYYQDGPKWKGADLASVAAVAVKSLDPTCTVEVKTKVIRPPVGDAVFCTSNEDLVAALSWLRMPADSAAVEDFLESRGWQIGRSYPHDQCPGNPGYASHGAPVFVGESAVYCHSCEGHGLKSRWPWNQLAGRPGLSQLATLVRNLTHWEHARLILNHAVTEVPEPILERCYRVLLLSEHPEEDPARIDAVFYAGRDFIRTAGRWVTRDFSSSYRVAALVGLLKSLPACNSPAKQDIFRQDADLTEYGYPPVENIVGCRVSSHYLPREGAPAAVVTPPPLLAAAGLPCPQYLPPEKRLPNWEEVFNRYFPGIDLDYLRLLIAAKGLVEAKTENPMVITTGPSGSAKSATVGVATAVCGDVLTELVAGLNRERLRQSMVATRGVFAAVNEVFKHSGEDPVAALNPVLTMTPDSSSHVMYVGPVLLGYRAIVFTDTSIPQAVAEDLQIARRLVHVHLPSRLAWDVALREHANNRPPAEMRLFGEEAIHAADTLLSLVIDKFFTLRIPAFVEIAEELGFGSLEKSPFIERPEIDQGDLYALFRAVCDAPVMEGGATHWKARGWKQFSRDTVSPLGDAWEAVCDGDRRWWESRRVSETDWGRILGVPYPVRCEVSKYGRRMAIRFSDTFRRVSATTRVNEELMTGPPFMVNPPP